MFKTSVTSASIALLSLASVAAVIAGCSSEPSSADGTASASAVSTTAESASASLPSPSDGIATIQFRNNCSVPLHVGTTIPNDGAHVYPPFTTIAPGGSYNRNIGPDNEEYPGLAYYGYRDGQNPGEDSYTLAEFHLNSSFYGLDFMDVSLVDGFNVPVRIAGIGTNCTPPAECPANLNQGCPTGQVVQNGAVIACSKHMVNIGSATSPLAEYFNARCPNAYGWSGDSSKDRTCSGQDYSVTFCP